MKLETQTHSFASGQGGSSTVQESNKRRFDGGQGPPPGAPTGIATAKKPKTE
jgi:hypothetical protein